MGKKWKIAVGTALLIIALGYGAWNIWFSSTRIAFVNYQVITLGEISKSNDHSRIILSSLGVDELENLHRYDMVLVNGMGLRITSEQRAELEKAAQNGTPIITTMATNPANEIISIDSVALTTIQGYLNGGGRSNYRNMLTYIRRNIDGKTLDSKEPSTPIMHEQKLFYHAEPTIPEDEDMDFGSVAEYQKFLKKHNLLQENAPAIIVAGQMGEPTELIAKLEQTGNVVYPVRNIQKLIIDNHIDSICPSAVINMAHGRIGDFIVDYLTRQNIPLFSPLNVNRLVEEWESDQMGMNGGFMSQSIVMPEIDGAIRPYALFGHYINNDGLQQVFAIPERLDKFVETVNNHIKLQRKPNEQKRIAIYYYKGPGQNALTAAGLEVVPSMYNLLKRLKSEGYRVENMPSSAEELNKLIQCQGSVYNSYANGAKHNFLKNGNPQLIGKEDYKKWTEKAISPQLMTEVVALDGEFPGSYISTEDGLLALPRVDLGNVVLLPQLAAGSGDDDFAIVHGTDAAPPHAYIASYLWAHYGFEADAMIHFGTHGSLEFTPKKQVALCSNDWADILVGSMPHLYIYSIGNVGEGMIAKRRSYATLQSHLTPPFMESNVRGIYNKLSTAIREYNDLLYTDNKSDIDKAALKVKQLVVDLGIHRELRLDSLMTSPYSEHEISRIETFAEELANEKITGELYTLGKPYSDECIRSSVYAMSIEPIAYSLLALDKFKGRGTDDLEKHKSLFTRNYLIPVRDLVARLLSGKLQASDAVICSVAKISKEELHKARQIEQSLSAPQGMMARMGRMKEMNGASKQYTKDEKEQARMIMELVRTIQNVGHYKTALEDSPKAELASLINALNGGYTTPSAGGDPIANPNSIPTGRNLYAVNAEATPTELSWERGKKLAENTIKMYRERHNDSIPRKVSYTLWSGEFVETEGATIAQILYMLGVEPIRDAFGRVNDIRLIPSEQLGRPRIDVVVQTSGQLRDIAASRLFLISRAVEMAAASKNDKYENFVAQGILEAERSLIEKGLSPKHAREVSTHRVFGGVNGNYGTGIADMVQSGDRWEDPSEIAEIYMQNMGAFYGSEKEWEQLQQFAFEVALKNTDAIIQPRQSNTWGALSLDHVYEFMGGMNLAVHNVSGKEPDAYLSDYRNRNNMRMQELKEAIGIESRTTIFNPSYIKGKMKGGANAAAGFADIIQNSYAWNVVKPEVIDDRLWDEVYNVYVEDKFNLNVRSYFETQNPAAFEEMTAVMMETARKGMWKASAEQLATIAKLHTELIQKHKPSCSDRVCNNAKLQEFIASKVSSEIARKYIEDIREIREETLSENNGMILRREELNPTDKVKTIVSNSVVGILAVVTLAVFILVAWCRRKNMEK